MTINRIVQVTTVAKCPACGVDIRMRLSADVEEFKESQGNINLKGKIVGAATVPHDCTPKVMRGKGGGM